MPDISMCADTTCPSASTCKRHEASGTRPSTWQSYADFQREPEAGKCGDYWEVKIS